MKKAFVSGRYHRGEYVVHTAKGDSVSMGQEKKVTPPPTEAPKRREEIRLEPWIRKALDDQRAGKQKASGIA